MGPGETPAEGRDIVRELAGKGEETLHRLADLPGGSRALKAIGDLTRRVDELGRKARGVERLEERVEALEREVAELRRGKPGA